MHLRALLFGCEVRQALLLTGFLASCGLPSCSSKNDPGSSEEAVGGFNPSSSGGSGTTATSGGGTTSRAGGATGVGGRLVTGTTGGTSGAGTNGTTGGAGGRNCGQSKLEAQPRAVNVAVVLDRSLSMNTALSATEPKTRWVAMRQALNGALTAVQDRISFGLKLFPDGAADCAVSNPGLNVNVGLGASVVSQIDQTIGSAVPGGGTPIADALSQVYDYFTTGPGSTLSGDRVVLLATDGAPNCNANLTCDASACIPNIENPTQTQNICQFDPSQCLDDTRAEDQVKRLMSQGVRTVVVGIPGTEYTQYQSTLNRLGAAGGLPNPDPTYDYFPVSADSGVAGLQTTLESITTQLIVSCQLQLTSTPPVIGLLNVVVDGQTIPQSSSDGWDVDTSTDPPSIILKGTTCQRIETQGAQSIDITYGCPTVIIG